MTIDTTHVQELERISLDAAHFKAAFRHHPAGVALITADGPQGPVAMTVSSISSVSADPALLVFSASAQSSSTLTIKNADTLIVHLLGADQLDLAQLGSTPGVDRFEDQTLWSRLETSEPYFPAASTWIRGRIAHSVDVGTTTLLVVQGLNSGANNVNDAASSEPTPLVYHNRSWHQLTEQSRIA